MDRRDVLKAALALPVFAARVQAKARVEKYRPCDGACCHDSPLRRGENETGCTACVFHDHSMQFDVNSGCRIMADPNLVDTLTEQEAKGFAKKCIGYPIPYASETMGEADPTLCCWRNIRA